MGASKLNWNIASWLIGLTQAVRVTINEGQWTYHDPASLWKPGQLLHPCDRKIGGVEYRKLPSPNISTQHGRNLITPPITAPLFSSFHGREAAEICDIFFSGFNLEIWNRTARRCLGEWSSPASRSWQKNSPSSTTEASGCWPVFTISKRFAHTRS